MSYFVNDINQEPSTIQIIWMLNDGYSQREIAERLEISYTRIRGRLRRARERYDCETTQDLVEHYYTQHERR